MPKPPDRIGQTVAQRYDLVQVIGRGGQGIVYEAADRWTQRHVAVKVIDNKALQEPHVVERLMREQEALTALRGTSAVELYDVCRGDGGELCLVMELLVGLDLDEHLYRLGRERRRMELSKLAEIFSPVVDTLETAHASGILHRDIKPANIFLLERGGVRLLDFGMARLKASAPLTAAGTVMGSPSFMAPEAWSGVSDFLDHRADVYSLGVVLFLVLAGELPFAGNSVQEKFQATMSAPRPSLRRYRPDLPRGADDWVAAALARDRDDRFANVRAMWNAFVTVFRVPVPGTLRPAAWWTVAKEAVQRFGRPSGAPTTSTPRRESTPAQVPNDRTIELDASELEKLGPPRPPPRTPPVERTVSMTDVVDVLEPPPAPPPPPPRKPGKAG